MDHLQVDVDDRGVARLVLDRPEVRNAFDATVIAELTTAARRLARDDVRAVVLAGAGASFSAGADLRWMRASRDYTREENVADARATAAMFRALDELPCAVIGQVHGHALGGGVGLVAICDVVVAAADTTFGFGEVRLGIAPAVISPFVVRTIGRSHARALFVTGRQFDAHHAQRIGLIHHVVAADELEQRVAEVVDSVLAAGPHAVAAAKQLPDMALAPSDEAGEATAQVIADLRVSDEGQEGLSAFLERRPPSWSPAAH